METIAKDLKLVLGESAEFKVGVLQLEFRQLYLIHNLLPHLRANRHPKYVTLVLDFFVWAELIHAEAHVVERYENKFSG